MFDFQKLTNFFSIIIHKTNCLRLYFYFIPTFKEDGKWFLLYRAFLEKNIIISKNASYNIYTLHTVENVHYYFILMFILRNLSIEENNFRAKRTLFSLRFCYTQNLIPISTTDVLRYRIPFLLH